VLRRTPTLLVLGAIALAAVPSPAAASSSAVNDCNAHGRLTGHYTVSQLRTALATMPADVQEYTNCYNVIQSQLLSQIPGHFGNSKDSPSSSNSSSFISTPLLVVLIVLVVGGGALAGVAIQRRGQPPSDG
jgi:hypothetical protein